MTPEMIADFDKLLRKYDVEELQELGGRLSDVVRVKAIKAIDKILAKQAKARVVRASEVKAQPMSDAPAEYAPIMNHPLLREHHPDYRQMVAWRFLTLREIPIDVALRCLDAGYTSPGAARFDGLCD